MKKLILLLIVAALFGSCKKELILPQTQTDTFEIGAWNMDETSLKYLYIPEYIKFDSIINVEAKIIQDGGKAVHIFSSYDDVQLFYTESRITMFIQTGSYFDNTIFSDTTMNRGSITIEYL